MNDWSNPNKPLSARFCTSMTLIPLLRFSCSLPEGAPRRKPEKLAPALLRALPSHSPMHD
jgi:hypothetical protein